MRCYLLLFFALFSFLSAQEDLVKLPISQPLHTVGRLGLGIDVVGWQPLQCPYTYAQMAKSENNKVKDRMFSVQGGYEAGFRLHADFYCAWGYLKLSYLWYEEKRAQLTQANKIPNQKNNILTLDNNILTPANHILTEDNHIIVPAVPASTVPYAFAKGELHYNYQNVELRWGNFLQKKELSTFDLFATARYARISHARQSTGLIQGFFEKTKITEERFPPAHDNEIAPKDYKHPVPGLDEHGKPMLDKDQQPIIYKQAQRPKVNEKNEVVTNAEGQVEQELLFDEYATPMANFDFIPVRVYRQKVKFEGGGVGVGFENQWNLWRWFGMRAECAALALIGQQKTLIKITTQPSEINYFNFDNHIAVIPEIDAKIGINYTWYANKLAVIIEVGYEIDYFWKALLLSDNTNKAARSCENIGFAGPYGRAVIRF